MTDVLAPRDADDVLDAVAESLATGRPVDVVAAGSKRNFGRPCETACELDVSALSGIDLYEPDELVVGMGAATPLVALEAALEAERQMLSFEPPDLGPVLGAPAGQSTVGGVLACNLSGPRRIMAGAARDHFLGFNAVSGRGEAFKSGGRVVKNVTGFDLSKLIAGSFGTLAVLTHVVLRVLPSPEDERTVLIAGLADAQAVSAMSAAMNGPYDVSGAAHLPAPVASASANEAVSGLGASTTAIRIEGPAPSVEARTRAVSALVSEFGPTHVLDRAQSGSLWREVRDVSYFAADGRQVWRISVAPAAGAGVGGQIAAATNGTVFYDWAGGLVWLAIPALDDAGHETIRGAIRDIGGHATLVRADPEVRAAVSVFQPQPAPLAALAARIKDSFDPRHVLNPGRMAQV
ncbi:MAG: glycolate oxidase subunit GlcE [Rhodospirillales bacterium]|jgi:glycolate oxidase FAD binding subunit|nr:glycolate oxidase subunit GlcE [Rhodospirillales bacterium]MDP6803923.1 glycolate oxidase subunit GlcE [Rhodospirillales bacterium]